MNGQDGAISGEGSAGVRLVLSLRDGEVWASWSDGGPPVNLGEHEAVLTEMRTFILQSEVAKRLIRATRKTLNS